MSVVRYVDSQGCVLAANFSLNTQLFGAAYWGACILTAASIIEFWEKVAGRRHSCPVLPTAVANVLPTHMLFDANILLLVLTL